MPRHRLGERDMLLAYLERQRELVFWKCEGLAEDLAHSVTTPSGMSIAGVVQHLENVERSWWRRHFAGQEGLTFDWSDDRDDAGMAVADGVTLADLLTRYRTEIALCDDVIAQHDLDDSGAMRDHTLRWILLHLIEEIGRHLGHLDLLRELADGVVGEEPEGAPPPGVDE